MHLNQIGNIEPLVSVIIPAYNCGKFIEQSIESVLKQTYKNIEIIVIDDGSTDDTHVRLLQYGDTIKYECINNQGSSKARNVGMGYSRGEYLAFLDADDVWHPRKLEMQIECFKNVQEIGLVFTDFSRIDMEGNIVQDRYEQNAFAVFQDYGLSIDKIFKGKNTIRIDDSNQGNSQLTLYFGDVFYELCKGNFILPSTTLFKKKCIDKIGLLWNEEFRCATDQYFHYERDGDFRFSKKVLYRTILGKHYSRLAYYYLSELDRANAKKYALYSLKCKPFLLKSFYTLLLSFTPFGILDYLKQFKWKVHGFGN